MDFILPLFILRSLVENPLLLLVVFLELLVFSSKLLVHINQIVDFLVEYVNVGEQVIVLFLSLDEGVLDLDDVSETCGFFDCIEGLIYDFHIPLIVINQFHFLLVVYYEFCQSLLQNSCSIVLDSADLSRFNSASPVELGIFKLLVKFSQTTIVVCFVFLIFHLQTQHEILAHVASVLTGFDVFGQSVDLLLSFVNISLQTFEVVLVHSLFLSQ